MITVTNNYKNTIRGNSRTFVAYVKTSSEEVNQDDGLVSVKIHQNADVGKAMVQRLDFSFDGAFDCLGEAVEVGIGVVVSGTPEYIVYGTFIVDSVEFNPDTELSTAVAYDKMYGALKEHRPVSISFPCTLYEYLEKICEREGWTLGTATFTNDDLVLEEDVFVGLTVREVLQKIAEVSGTVCLFDNDDELVFRSITGASVETVSINDVFSQKINAKWGDLNSVAFDFPPYGDLIWTGGYEHPLRLLEDEEERALEDGTLRGTEEWVEVDGFHQYLISESELASQEATDGLFGALDGYSFYPVELDTVGLGWLEVGDRITVQDRNSNNFETTVTNVEVDFSDGYKVRIYTSMLELARGGTAKTSPRNVGNVRVKDGNVQDITVNKLTDGNIITQWRIVDPDTGVAQVLIGRLD